MSELLADIVGTIILAVLIVQAVKWCLRAAGEVGEALADGVGGDIPAQPQAPRDVQDLRDRGGL